MIALRLMTRAEQAKAEDDRRAALTAYRLEHPEVGDTWTEAMRTLSRSFQPPGSVWECPWYFDPENPEDQERRERNLARPESDYNPSPTRGAFLSLHYWRDWSHIRPPLCVVCPDHGHWIPDQVSSNGTGWTVTGWQPGDVSKLVCTPSIDTGTYHGWLGCNGAPPGHFGAPL